MTTETTDLKTLALDAIKTASAAWTGRSWTSAEDAYVETKAALAADSGRCAAECIEAGDLDAALEHIKKAAEIAREFGDVDDWGPAVEAVKALVDAARLHRDRMIQHVVQTCAWDVPNDKRARRAPPAPTDDPIMPMVATVPMLAKEAILNAILDVEQWRGWNPAGPPHYAAALAAALVVLRWYGHEPTEHQQHLLGRVVTKTIMPADDEAQDQAMTAMSASIAAMTDYGLSQTTAALWPTMRACLPAVHDVRARWGGGLK